MSPPHALIAYRHYAISRPLEALKCQAKSYGFGGPESIVIRPVGQKDGATSLRAIAAGLNERGIPTARGTGTWSATQVMRLLGRRSCVSQTTQG
jgi:hypothetical protein